LYEEKKYAELSYILQDTFKFDRVRQLNMLLDSLWQLQQYEVII